MTLSLHSIAAPVEKESSAKAWLFCSAALCIRECWAKVQGEAHFISVLRGLCGLDLSLDRIHATTYDLRLTTTE